MKYLILFLSVLIISCQHHFPKSSKDWTKGSWGDTEYSMYKGLYFSGQPDMEELEQAIEEDQIKAIVNLRPKSEDPKVFDKELELAGNKNVAYYNIPIDGSKELDKKQMDKIETVVRKHHKNKENVIIHCSSGQRAMAWFAVHLIEHHKMSVDKGLKLSGKGGLKNDGLKDKVRTYFKK